jgi:hypothetical protein
MEPSLLIVFIILGIAWFWYSSSKATEIANHVAINNCSKWNVQFLDGTVHLKSMGITRGRTGSMVLRRQFQFEFNNNDNNRYYGYITLVGTMLESIIMDDIIEVE